MQISDNKATTATPGIISGSTILPKAAAGAGLLKPVATASCSDARYSGPVCRIETISGKVLACTPGNLLFGGFASLAAKEDVFYVYLMHKEGVGFRIGIARSYRIKTNSFVRGYTYRCNQERADRMYLIAYFYSESEARMVEQMYSLQYGIPTFLFPYRAIEVRSAISEAHFIRLFELLDTDTAAKRLLSDLNMFIQYPHHVPKCKNVQRRRNFSVTLFADVRGRVTYHSYTISGNGIEDGDKLRKAGVNVRKAKVSNGWRLEGYTPSVETIKQLIASVQHVLGDVNVIEKARLSKGDQSLLMLPASHVMPGMKLFVHDAGRIVTDTVKSNVTENYSGAIVSQQTALHNFVANDFVCGTISFRPDSLPSEIPN